MAQHHASTWFTIPIGTAACSDFVYHSNLLPGSGDQKVHLGTALTTVPTLCSEPRPRPPASPGGRRLSSSDLVLVSRHQAQVCASCRQRDQYALGVDRGGNSRDPLGKIPGLEGRGQRGLALAWGRSRRLGPLLRGAELLPRRFGADPGHPRGREHSLVCARDTRKGERAASRAAGGRVDWRGSSGWMEAPGSVPRRALRAS